MDQPAVREAARHGSAHALAASAGVSGQLIETCWRVVGATGNEFKCAIYGSWGRWEVRVTCDDETRVHCEIVEDVKAGRELAHRWLRRLLKNESFRRRF